MLYYLGIGSNLGDREAYLRGAIDMIEERVGHVLRRSSFYYSAAQGFRSEHEFANICIAMESRLEPMDVLDATQQIERELGRTQKSGRDADGRPVYHDRTVDIDLLLCYGDDGQPLTQCSQRLTLPHPHIAERDFVIVPLKEIFV